MIWLYTGTPGSGKSLDMAQDILHKVGRGQNVVCNFEINHKMIKGSRKGKCICLKDKDLSPKYLYDYAMKNHMKKRGKKGFEGQTLLMIDEAQRMFGAKIRIANRVAWMTFFQLHRHYGYNIILATQMKKSITGELLGLVEYEVKHRKLNNFKLFGAVLGLLSGGALFVAVEYWTGAREKTNSRFYTFSRRLNGLYDSYAGFDEEYTQSAEEKLMQKMMDMQKQNVAMPEQVVQPIAYHREVPIRVEKNETIIDGPVTVISEPIINEKSFDIADDGDFTFIDVRNIG